MIKTSSFILKQYLTCPIHILQLLNGRVEEDEVPEEYSSLEGANLKDKLTIINARLNQRNSAYDVLKSELNKYKEECVNLQGVKAGLNSRMSQQEQTIMQMKTQLLKLDFIQQNSDTELTELHKHLQERDREISALRSELIRRDRTVEKQRAELEDALKRIDEMRYAQVKISINTEKIFSGTKLFPRLD